jgi:hypothetical protein
MSSYFPTLRLLRTFPRQYRIIRRSHHRRPSCRLPHRTSRPTTTGTYRRDNLYPLRLCHRWSRLCSDHWTRTQGHSRNGLYLDGGIQHLPPICRMGISRRDRVRQSTSQVYRCYQCLPILNHLDARESTVLHENGADRFCRRTRCRSCCRLKRLAGEPRLVSLFDAMMKSRPLISMPIGFFFGSISVLWIALIYFVCPEASMRLAI